MKTRAAETLLWAQRVMRNSRSAPHELLDVPANATADQVQEAFHKIARSAHPDLHRNFVNADELELITSAYATVAGAYQAMRTREPQPEQVGPQTTEPPPVTGAIPTVKMSSKALVYYRKAELCLKRGDLKGAMLQLKLACAADPSSAFLRTALAEVQTEARKLS